MILEHILLHDAEHIDEKEKLENARKLLFWAGYYLANAKPNHNASTWHDLGNGWDLRQRFRTLGRGDAKGNCPTFADMRQHHG